MLSLSDVVDLGDVVVVLHDDLLDRKHGAGVVSDVIGAAHNLETGGVLALDTMDRRHRPVLGDESCSTEVGGLAALQPVTNPAI